MKYFLILLASCATVRPQIIPPITTEKHTLIIGDSHSDYYGNRRGDFGFFGQRLQELTGADLIAISGATPGWYLTAHKNIYGCTSSAKGVTEGCASAPNPTDFIGYDDIIIELGANSIGGNPTSDVDSFISLLTFKKCYWIGPISAPRYSASAIDRAESQIKNGIKNRCTYIDSRDIKFENGKLHDNEHMNESAYENWANLVFKKL